MSISPMKRGIQLAVSTVQLSRRVLWFLFRPVRTGVDAIALTPAGHIILVELNYAKGWRLPGGGCRKHETARHAIERELREEIGLTSFGRVIEIAKYSHRKHYKHETIHVFLLDDVRHYPRWSIEISAVQEFELCAIPADAAHARTWIAQARAMGHIA